jgi:hypothetical protein
LSAVAVIEYSDYARALALQMGGKIVAAGGFALTLAAIFVAVRLHCNGSLDVGFDGDGKL